LCLTQCLCREQNVQNFVGVETLVLELWKIMFNTFYTWIYHRSFLFLILQNFFELWFYLFLQIKGLLYAKVEPLCTYSMILELLITKKKRKK
jgi:hypothetical protein